MIYRRALVSVYDKTGLEEFLKPLAEQGLEIVSTGGTAQFLKSKNFKIEEVKDLTHFPELLSGRVKTLHPHIFVPLLSRDWEAEDIKTLKDYKMKAFDLLVINLYPFKEKALDKEDKEAVEWIDIGGPSLLRAGAKNYFRVMTICDVSDYSKLQKRNDLEMRREMAIKVFNRLSDYNSNIAETLLTSSHNNQKSKEALNSPDFNKTEASNSPDSNKTEASNSLDSNKTEASNSPDFNKTEASNSLDSNKTEASNSPDSNNTKASNSLDSNNTETDYSLSGHFFKKLRYGENPQQSANWYQNSPKGLHQAQILQGKALSYNNLLDFETSLQTLKDFPSACAVAVKHNNPCGVATAPSLSSALEKTLKADPLSIFGGVIALNKKVNEEEAESLKSIFLEGLIAPDFSEKALEILKKKPNLRVLKWPDLQNNFPKENTESIRDISGGFLVQNQDNIEQEFNNNWEIFGEAPSEEIKKDLLFAWKVCAHLKSNAIALVKEGQTLGLGMGQVNRVDAVKSALKRAKEFHPQHKENLILASDAFFPFPDSVEWAKKGAVRWIIQPGGSIKDQEVLKKAKELKINIVLTGKRHFKH